MTCSLPVSGLASVMIVVIAAAALIEISAWLLLFGRRRPHESNRNPDTVRGPPARSEDAMALLKQEFGPSPAIDQDGNVSLLPAMEHKNWTLVELTSESPVVELSELQTRRPNVELEG